MLTITWFAKNLNTTYDGVFAGLVVIFTYKDVENKMLFFDTFKLDLITRKEEPYLSSFITKWKFQDCISL